VTTNSDLDQIVDQYLHRLEVALAVLPPQRRHQLIESITDHIREARVTLSADSEVAIRDILDRVGEPADIAAGALADDMTPAPPRSSGTRRLIVAGVAIVVVLLLVLLLVVGVVLVPRSNNNVSNTMAKVTTSTAASATRVVPNVVGLSLNSAETELEQVQFAFVVTFSCAGNQVTGVVTAQTPPPGSSATEGSRIQLNARANACP